VNGIHCIRQELTVCRRVHLSLYTLRQSAWIHIISMVYFWKTCKHFPSLLRDTCTMGRSRYVIHLYIFDGPVLLSLQLNDICIQLMEFCACCNIMSIVQFNFYISINIQNTSLQQMIWICCSKQRYFTHTTVLGQNAIWYTPGKQRHKSSTSNFRACDWPWPLS